MMLKTLFLLTTAVSPMRSFQRSPVSVAFQRFKREFSLSTLTMPGIGQLGPGNHLQYICKGSDDIEVLGAQISKILDVGDVLLLQGTRTLVLLRWLLLTFANYLCSCIRVYYESR